MTNKIHQRPAPIKRPLEFHLKCTVFLWIVMAVFLYFAILAAIPEFPPLKTYFPLKFFATLGLQNAAGVHYLHQLETLYHLKTVFIGCIIFGGIVSFIFLYLVRSGQNKTVVQSGGKLDSQNLANRLKGIR